MSRRRTHLCMDCRTALRAGERCSGGRLHRLAKLADPEGAELLRAEVWDSPTVRDGGLAAVRAKKNVYTAIAMALAFAAFVTLLELFQPASRGRWGLVVAGLVALPIIALVIWSRRHLLFGRVSVPTPHGARQLPAQGADVDTFEGEVRGAGILQSPMGRRDCALWAGVVTSSEDEDGSTVMYRDGETAGFVLRTHEGQEIRVPRGRIDFSCGDAAGTPYRGGDLHGYLAASGSTLKDHRYPTIPGDLGRELCIQEGDRIRLRAAVRPIAARDGGGYREAEHTLEAEGVPVLELG